MPPPYSAKATAFGKKLEAEFVTKLGGPTIGPHEIKKFTALIDSFTAIGGGPFLVESYHGARYQVTFPAISPWTRPSPRCELSDVLFVTYTTSEIRVSFLQAKSSCAPVPLPVWVANTEQYAVLATRPTITAVAKDQPWENDILSSATLPSAGSFGMFFDKVVGGKTIVEFHYVVADVLQAIELPKKSGLYVSCKFDVALPIQVARSYSGFTELLQCQNIADFGSALYALRIGTPIHAAVDSISHISSNGAPASLNARRRLAAWIDGEESPSDALRSLRRILEVSDIPNDSHKSIGARHVVIIRADNQ